MTYYGNDISSALLKEGYKSIKELFEKYNYDDLQNLGLRPLCDWLGSDWAVITKYKYPVYIENVETKVKYVGNHTWEIKDYVYCEYSFHKK